MPTAHCIQARCRDGTLHTGPVSRDKRLKSCKLIDYLIFSYFKNNLALANFPFFFMISRT